ncbi:MAG: EthD domain-containing protein [Rhizobiaceae bacterium]|nr:EthD domain-containing protein [Rhizobiaceae bacterium]MCV0404906.1 EthD domain-containing protein [Rhizobiaceae bacterium]
MATTRRFTFVRRGAGASREAFLAALRARAGGLAPSGLDCIVNQAQPAIDGLIPEPLWDGLVETEPAEPDVLGESLLLKLLDNSETGADRNQMVEFIAEAKIVLDGPARGVKILSLPRRKAGSSPGEFSRHYREVHGALVARNEAFVEYANRYVQHHLLPGTVRATGGVIPYDGISEFWFDSLDHARSAWEAPSYMAELRADEKNFVGSPPSHRLLVVPVDTA